MFVVVGAIVVLGCVAGGFVLSHGQLAALWQPYELLVIGGAAFGAFIMANPPGLVKKVLGALPGLFKGSPYGRAFYMDALALMYEVLAKARKNGVMSIEGDVEDPRASEVFKKFPRILADHHVLEFITDYLRLIASGSITRPYELDALIDVELDSHAAEGHEPAAALTRVSDGLPGFGIVAAVLGIVITMGAIGGPPEEIGHHVAAALVGTFLGILLAYGFVGPLAVLLEHGATAEGQVLRCLKSVLVAALSGYAPQIAVEFGRKAIGHDLRPSFAELENRIKGR
ncbi:MAG: flagellar motor stator protein MotA [Gammaproteobacteria bacterium]|nr:flagellar motor stator protein MotA [Gammaproteobacteria bacterium]